MRMTWLLPPLISQSLIDDRNFQDRFDVKTSARINIGPEGLAFQRSSLFDGIRAAFGSSSHRSIVTDDTARDWTLTIESMDGKRSTVLESGSVRFRLQDFWALSPDREWRLHGFELEANTFNLASGSRRRWLEILAIGPIDDDNFSRLDSDLRLTPLRVASGIAESFKFGGVDVEVLVPRELGYFEQLVGLSAGDGNLQSYASTEIRVHVSELLCWSELDGLKQALLLSSHSLLTSAVDPQAISTNALEVVFAWAANDGDLISKLGTIELGLTLLDKMPQLASSLEQMVDDIRTDDPEDEGGRFSLLSSLTILACGQMARTQVLRGKRPFWARLAAIAQASVVEREAVAVGTDRAKFANWTQGCGRGHYFYLQGLVDLRREPRWLPDFASPSQLKAEFIGRIAKSAADNEGKIQSPSLRKLLFDEGLDGIQSLMTFPFPYLPGPLEGGEESMTAMPAEFLAKIEDELAAEILHPSSFAGLVNCALIFRITADHARLAATAIRRVKYQLRKIDTAEQMFALISGLATVSAVTRSEELANEIRILSRVARRRRPTEITAEDELKIALVAAASRENLESWAKFAGDWLTELAFDVLDPDDAGRLLANIRCLVDLEPALAISCAKADAALSSLFR